MTETESTEKMSLFFEIASNSYKAAIERSKIIDDKAFKVLSAAVVMMALLPFMTKAIPSRSCIDLALSAIFLAFFLLADMLTCFNALKAMSWINYPTFDIPSLNPNSYLQYPLSDIYGELYRSYQPDIKKLSEQVDRKAGYLKWSMYSLALSLLAYFVSAAFAVYLGMK